MTFQTSPLDEHVALIQTKLNEGNTNAEVARILSREIGIATSEASIRRAIERHELERPGLTPAVRGRAEQSGLLMQDDSAVIVGNADVKHTISLGDTEDLMRERGLDPDDWELERVTVNEWEAPSEGGQPITMRQLKLSLKRKIAMRFVTPAVEVERLNLPKPRRRSENDKDYALAVIVGDEQEPYSDPELKQCFLDWLGYNKPDRGIHLGDLMDFPTISRHKDNPEWAAPVQDCIDAGYATLKAYVLASPSTKWELLVGNHDERLRNELLLRAERMYGIKPAYNGTPQEDVFSIKRLLHLDDLGIKFNDPKGGYAHAHTKLSDTLGVRHGWLTGANAAGSSLDRLGHSIIVGHTHHQRVHYKTVYGIDNQPHILQAVEAGTMCRGNGGLGYVINPDWQPGFATATIHKDGTFNIELATFNNGILRWRDQKYGRTYTLEGDQTQGKDLER